jgi:hypothetical protein
MRGRREEVRPATATVVRGDVGILFYGLEITTPILVVLLSRDEIAARKRLLVFPEQPLTPEADKAQLAPLDRHWPICLQGKEAIIFNLWANKRILIS